MSNTPFSVATVVTDPQLVRELTPSVEAIALGLENYEVIGAKGDLAIIRTQKKFAESGRTEPCLLLVNKRSPRERHVFIPLSQMHMLIHPRTMAENAPALCRQLYGFITRDDLFRVSDVIYEFADDLKNAPAPKRMGSKQWMDALARDGWTFANNGRALNG